MSSAMNILSSLTFFVLFVSLVFSKSLNFEDKNLIDLSNLKNVLASVILNDEKNNNIIKKRQDSFISSTFINRNGLQINGGLANLNTSVIQEQKQKQLPLNSILSLLQQHLKSVLNQLSFLITELELVPSNNTFGTIQNGLLFISKSYELNDQDLADNSLTAQDVPSGVILNDEVDNHIIEKRQRSSKTKKNRQRKRRQLTVSINSILTSLAQLQQQLTNVQAQIMQLTATTTTVATTTTTSTAAAIP
ncbi:Hypothetical protein SRAE_0000056200 [Strongyloides ratti]|uniref:Basic-leucine zipper domain-containing protein n=1 Tax=Strongyloides ratti TaxID=34506 RepID=A0A090MSZ6_STRRB|nr:Hypothetical protein SRAE_0000056200 [Strongyloides ratti]CEF61438.1 Hypothetical protein SRAE_0000056200 [Strongyloides ratti]